MIDMSAIAGTVGGLKTLGETVKGMIEARDSALAAHSDQFAMLDKIRQLEEEKAALEAWNTEKERYALKEVKTGVFTYVLKKEMSDSEPTHQICANCYQNKRVSILQRETRTPSRATVLVCNHCGSEIFTIGDRRAGHAKPPPRRR